MGLRRIVTELGAGGLILLLSLKREVARVNHGEEVHLLSTLDRLNLGLVLLRIGRALALTGNAIEDLTVEVSALNLSLLFRSLRLLHALELCLLPSLVLLPLLLLGLDGLWALLWPLVRVLK